MPRFALLTAIASLATTACKGSSSDDTCQKLVAKMVPLMIEEGQANAADPKEQQLGVEECRKHLEDTTGSPQAKCLLAANTEDEVRACMADQMKKLEGEAKYYLNGIKRAATRAFTEHGSFPKGTARQLPAAPAAAGANPGPCCFGEHARCAASSEWSSDPTWKALGFSIAEAGRFQFTYESTDGTTFTAIATGDTDCDTTPATFTLTGTAAGGKVTTKLVEPPHGVY